LEAAIRSLTGLWRRVEASGFGHLRSLASCATALCYAAEEVAQSGSPNWRPPIRPTAAGRPC